jgi:hypothetical protein
VDGRSSVGPPGDRPPRQLLLAKPLDVRQGQDARGAYAEVTIPTLSFWSMVVFRYRD